MPDDTQQPIKVCAYCGAQLDPHYYFCPQCATPYQREDNILPKVLPIKLTDGALINRKAPMVWTMVGRYVGVIVFAGIASYAFGKDNFLAALVFGSVLMFLTTSIFAAIYWKALIVQFKVFGFNRWEALVSFMGLAGLLFINYYLYKLLRNTFPDSPDEGTMISEMPRQLQIMLICVFPAVTEEISFRGLIQHWLSATIKPWKALALASALFAALHFNVVLFPYLFLVGMLLGWAKQRTRSLYPSILLHFLHNFIVLDFV